MDLQQFIERYKEEASKVILNIDTENYLKGCREAILNPDFEEERQKALKTAKKVVVEQKKRLRHFISLHFEGDRLKGKYIGSTPPHIFDLKLYLEYKELLSLGEKSKKEKDHQKKNKKETDTYKHLFKIGLKLASGEVDEFLVFDKNGSFKAIKENYSYPTIAKYAELDNLHLKCTLGNYPSNKPKNLHNNPDIVEDVLTHLKSIGKEPKEWFLNEFVK